MKRNASSPATEGPPPSSATAPAPRPTGEPGAADIPASDTVAQIEKLLDKLKAERGELIARLEKVDRLLGNAAPAATPPVFERPKNQMILRDAVIQVLKKKASTKDEILDAVVKMGYEFYGRNPKSSINVVLYTKKNKFRKTGDGRFLPPEE